MGEAKLRGKVVSLDPSDDRALVTKRDLQSVQVWCDQLRTDVQEMQDDRDEQLRQRAEQIAAELRSNVQALAATVDTYRQDELVYRNNVSVRGRLRRLKWWLLTVLPFGIGACYAEQSVGNSRLLNVTVDSTRGVACYSFGIQSGPLSCVRIDSVQVWRARDSSWVLR